VKVHIAAILRVLQVRNRTEAVVRARELGLCPSS
jgi:DNA-binding NarL/FixJ family response regulator